MSPALLQAEVQLHNFGLSQILMKKKFTELFAMGSQNLLQSLGYMLGLPACAEVFANASPQLLVCKVELEEVPRVHFQLKCSLIPVHPNIQMGR